MNGTTAYALSKQYVADTADSLGSLKGAPCTIKSQTETDDSYIVTFEWTGTSGAKETSQLTIKKPKDGIDGLPGKDGKDGLNGTDGIGISKIEKISTVDLVDTYRITFSDNSTFDYEVKNGKDGQGGSGGSGEENKINSISVNGVNVEIDQNKNVDITVPSIDGLAKTEDIPTKVSELTNDSGYLTEHQDISGKVDKVEGKSLISDTEIARLASVDNYDDTDIKAEIANKADATAIPSKVSVLENDSKYQTESDVTTTLTDYATKTYVGEQITNAEHLKREIVTVLPSDTEASDNIIYMLKVESTTGNDKYQEYMKIDGTVQMVGDTSVDLTDYAKTVDIPTTVAELTDSSSYAKKTDIPTTLPADGGNSDTVNNHTVETNVPADAVFTDTIYDDTEVKGSISELSSNLDTLAYGENAGGKNLIFTDELVGKKLSITQDIGGIAPNGDTITFSISTTTNDDMDNSKSVLYIMRTDGTNSTPVNNGQTLTLTDDDKNNFLGYRVNVIPSLEGKIVKSIQVEVGTTATEYEPYFPSNKMLAEEISKQNESLSVIGKCKNLLNTTLQTTTMNGIECTNNGDGTYTLNGNATTNTWFTLGKAKLYSGKTYRLCGLNKVGNSTLYIQLRNDNIIMQTTNNGIDVSITETSENYLVVAFIPENTTYNNVIYKPMITTNLSATYDDFVPYTGDGDTLTHDVAELKNDLGGLSFSASGTTLTITDGTNTWTLGANS